MEELIQKQYTSIAIIFYEKLLPVFLNKITDHHNTMVRIGSLQKKMMAQSFTKQDEKLAIDEIKKYKEELEILISGYFSTLTTETDVLFFDTYYTSLDRHLETVDETLTRPQDKERFLSDVKDSKFLKFKKAIKRVFFTTSKIPLKTANIFRKTKKKVNYWNQNIPLKNATQYYFKGLFIHNLSKIIDAIYKEISQITNTYWVIDTKIDDEIKNFLFNNKEWCFPEELLNNFNAVPTLESRIEMHKKLFEEVFEATILAYKNALYKADTIELSAGFFSIPKINQYQKNVLDKSVKQAKAWENTYMVYRSDWELDIEIYIVIFKVMIDNWTMEGLINLNIDTIHDEVTNIKKYIETVKNTVAIAQTDAQVEQTIATALKNLNKGFKKYIKKATNTITSQEIPTLLNNFEENTVGHLKNISTKRAISSDSDYLSPTAASSINYISPYELLSYESWPLLAIKIKESKVELAVQVNTFMEALNAIPQISEFNLESAMSLFENVSKENTPKKVALEGLERSIEKVEELKNALATFKKLNSEIIEAGIHKFNKSILELTNTENIVKIRLTIAKAKSIEKSKQIKDKIVNNVKNFVPIALGYVKTNYKKSATYIRNLLLRTGLYSGSSHITTDLSDFLRQAEKALDELPYVYQRLFRSETLQNEELFVGRYQELQVLETAFSVFNNSQYGSTIINGERGAGKTSLIHYFLNNNNIFKQTVFLSPTVNIHKPDEFIAFLNTSFSQNFETLEQWIQFFNSGKKRTIVLENIQYLYFRKVHGFAVLNQLSILITATKNNVFWIVTLAKYAFEYLDKSIHISDLFAYSIELSEIDKKIMVEALLKRHKISGYNLFFENPPEEYITKNFLKTTTVIQQESLKEDFFSDMNKIAQSNFKIAFMYWICATVKVEGSTIYMQSLKSINTSFLDKIAPVKLLLLNSILLQGRLSMEQIIELSSLDSQPTRNLVHNLYEHGLLTIDDGEFYTLNILLFRQITSLLKSKNLIH